MKICASPLSLTFFRVLTALVAAFLLAACARTEIVESPRTAFAAATDAPEQPAVIWTSRMLSRNYDYLGIVKSRSWTYDGALERLVAGGKELNADAIIDVNYQRVGFLDTMEAFAIKFRNKP